MGKGCEVVPSLFHVKHRAVLGDPAAARSPYRRGTPAGQPLHDGSTGRPRRRIRDTATTSPSELRSARRAVTSRTEPTGRLLDGLAPPRRPPHRPHLVRGRRRQDRGGNAGRPRTGPASVPPGTAPVPAPVLAGQARGAENQFRPLLVRTLPDHLRRGRRAGTAHARPHRAFHVKPSRVPTSRLRPTGRATYRRTESRLRGRIRE